VSINMRHASPPTPASSLSNCRDAYHLRHQQQQKRQYYTWGKHSPVVMAMLTNNRLQDCGDVIQMLKECQKSQSTDQVCSTAAKYLQVCDARNVDDDL
jgi:capsid portal protein